MTHEAPRPETATTGAALDLERYVEGLFAGEDDLLVEIRRESEGRGFPRIHVPPVTGRALQLLLKAKGARRVLEVGTLTGYSAVWMARALPSDGRLLTLEADPVAAEAARSFLAKGGLEDRVEVREGRAQELLPELDGGAYDAIFLDADKAGLVRYADEAARLLAPGGLLLADNALWKGRVVEPDRMDDDTRAVHEFNVRMAQDERYDATVLPVGDGVLTALRR